METVLFNHLLNAFTGLILCLGISNSVNLLIKALGALSSLPGARTLVAKENFDFLNGLAASFRIGKPELNRSQYAKGSKNEEETEFNIAEGWRNEKADSKVELVHVRVVNATRSAL